MPTTTTMELPQIVAFDATHDWSSLLQLARPELDDLGLRRLKHVLDGKCTCVVIERHYIDKDYRDTFYNFHSKRFATPSSRCVRLHFFSKHITDRDIISGAQEVRAAYLGYSILRPTKPNCIGRTMLNSRLRLSSEAHIRVCRETASLMGTDFEVEGFPFISQDADVTVCAESALWMILRYYSNTYSTYGEILPFQITNLAVHHAGGHRVYPSSGLYSWQIAEALRLQKFSPVIYSRNQFKAFDHLLYTYIESGIPLLVTVPRHVVSAFGHQSDYSIACPRVKEHFLYSSFFNTSFVINDDNCFPYQMLHSGGPSSSTDSDYNWSQIQEIIVPLPEKVFLTAEQAQTAIEAALLGRNKANKLGIHDHSPTLAHLYSPSPNKVTDCLLGRKTNLILRLYLTSARSFKRRLHNREGMGNAFVENLYRHLPMPHFIWVCELADANEYARDSRILGEVIWDATRNAWEPDGLIALHYPEKVIFDAGSTFTSQASSSLEEFSLAGSTSYLLYTSNLNTL